MAELIRFAVPNGSMQERTLQILRAAGYALPMPIGRDDRIGVANGIEFFVRDRENIASLVQRGVFDAGITGVDEGFEQVTEEMSWHTRLSLVPCWRVSLQVCQRRDFRSTPASVGRWPSSKLRLELTCRRNVRGWCVSSCPRGNGGRWEISSRSERPRAPAGCPAR